MPVLAGLSLFAILLALAAGVRWAGVSEAERFVVEGCWGVVETTGAAAGAKAGGWCGGRGWMLRGFELHSSVMIRGVR